jgi:hypothetical protein
MPVWSFGMGLAMGGSEEDTGQGAPNETQEEKRTCPATVAASLPGNLVAANPHNPPATFTDHTPHSPCQASPTQSTRCARDGKSNLTTCFHHYYIRSRPQWRAMLKTLPSMPVSGITSIGLNSSLPEQLRVQWDFRISEMDCSILQLYLGG